MNNQKTLLAVVYAMVLFVTITIAVLLFWEYRCFQHEARELSQVKDAYYQHVEMLKRSLNASMLSTDEEEQETDSEKKKINETSSDLEEDSADDAVDSELEDQKIEFQVISDDEEHRLKEIKSGLQIIPKQKNIRKKSKARRSIAKVVKPSVRYAPRRDFVFSWPVDIESFWLSSLFGPRKRPNGQVEFHHAIDMAAMKGTPVKAAAMGTVIVAQTLSGFGNCIMIEHNKHYKTRYAHLHRIGVRVGQVVQEGQYIGSVGDTGLVRKSGRDASHLHFEVHQDGRRVNPLAFLFS